MNRPAEFWLDLLLFVLVIVLLAPRLTGLPAHEWLGLCLAALLILHLLFSWRWISTATRRLGRPMPARFRINYLINVTLFVLVMLVIVSGVVISRVALPRLGVTLIEDRSWRALHNLTLNWLTLFTGLHLAMNWEWVVRMLRPEPRRAISRYAALTVRAPAILAGRSVVLLGAAGVVGLGAYAVLGPPSSARRFMRDEIARFAPTAGHGLGQLAGEAMLVCLVAYVGRRWLRVRL
jgi:hypothetical protein